MQRWLALLYYLYYLRLRRLACFWSELTILSGYLKSLNLFSVVRRLPRSLCSLAMTVKVQAA
ncbi:MAG: hypothetical protein IJV35_04790 [Neisseriaceae bacterium]|nr:hypothetical protein [Neisseriaceae bacterium]